jgi:hypothetical protein
VLNGFEVRDLPTGTVYLRLPHYADPTKDHEWLEEQRRLMADTPDQFKREILMDETLVSGQPIYTNYQDDVHCPEKYRLSGIPLVPGAIYYGGWDCGQTLSPAFVLLQITPNPFQVHFLQEVVSTGGESMEDFAPRVFDALLKRLPGLWDTVTHFGDATVTTRSGSDSKSARDVARKHGLEIRPVSNVWPPRLAAMQWLFSRWIDTKTPGVLIDAKGCPTFRQACQGAYQYRISATGEQEGPGAVIMAPLKNAYSHVAEAAQYPAIKIRNLVEGTGTRKQEAD